MPAVARAIKPLFMPLGIDTGGKFSAPRVIIDTDPHYDTIAAHAVKAGAYESRGEEGDLDPFDDPIFGPRRPKFTLYSAQIIGTGESDIRYHLTAFRSPGEERGFETRYLHFEFRVDSQGKAHPIHYYMNKE